MLISKPLWSILGCQLAAQQSKPRLLTRLSKWSLSRRYSAKQPPSRHKERKVSRISPILSTISIWHLHNSCSKSKILRRLILQLTKQTRLLNLQVNAVLVLSRGLTLQSSPHKVSPLLMRDNKKPNLPNLVQKMDLNLLQQLISWSLISCKSSSCMKNRTWMQLP
jgi:hypothetical protein